MPGNQEIAGYMHSSMHIHSESSNNPEVETTKCCGSSFQVPLVPASHSRRSPRGPSCSKLTSLRSKDSLTGVVSRFPGSPFLSKQIPKWGGNEWFMIWWPIYNDNPINKNNKPNLWSFNILYGYFNGNSMNVYMMINLGIVWILE